MNTPGEVTWQDPPKQVVGRKAGGRGQGKLAPYVQLLKERPGQWAYFGVWAYQAKGLAIQRNYPGVEYTSRQRTDGKVDIYLRWVGEGNWHA